VGTSNINVSKVGFFLQRVYNLMRKTDKQETIAVSLRCSNGI